MNYGYFDDEHHEYIIARPDVPIPWTNHLGAEEMGASSLTGFRQIACVDKKRAHTSIFSHPRGCI